MIEHPKNGSLCEFLLLEIRPRTFITSGSLGVMGAGLPFAIGAQASVFWGNLSVGRMCEPFIFGWFLTSFEHFSVVRLPILMLSQFSLMEMDPLE